MTTEQKQLVGVAIASLVLGILGLIMIGLLGAIPAVICGHIAKSKIRKDPETLTGDGMALAGLIMGYISIGIAVLIIPIMLLAAIAIPSFVKAREKALENTKEANLNQIECAIAQYALDNALTAGTHVSWEDLSYYLKETNKWAYNVDGDAIDESTLAVDENVEYDY